MSRPLSGGDIKMAVLINFLLQNINLVSVLSKIYPKFAGHVKQEWQISWTLFLSLTAVLFLWQIVMQRKLYTYRYRAMGPSPISVSLIHPFHVTVRSPHILFVIFGGSTNFGRSVWMKNHKNNHIFCLIKIIFISNIFKAYG